MSGAYSVTITNLTTPLASPVVAPNVYIKTIVNHDFVNLITAQLPNLTPGTLGAPITYSISPNTLNCPFGVYRFNMTTTVNSAQGSTMKITFPASYSFTTGCSCGTLTGLLGKFSYNRFYL
jgi:hypothetical protein